MLTPRAVRLSILALLLTLLQTHATGAAPPATPLWAVIGNDGAALASERAAGIEAKVVRCSWRNFTPTTTTTSATYLAQKQAEVRVLRAAGFQVILDIGLQDTPTWLHAQFPDSHYHNQWGAIYDGGGAIDSGDANLVFNPALRAAAATYIHAILGALGSEAVAVRVGGGRYGELTYPPASYGGRTNVYWAFDANARAQSPTPGWVPGQPSAHGEAALFAGWYLDALVRFQQWQIATVQQSFGGAIMILYPRLGRAAGPAGRGRRRQPGRHDERRAKRRNSARL